MPQIATKLLIISMLGLILSGCSFGKKENVPLPAVLESYFRSCQPLDGAMSMQLFLSGALQGSVEVDWVSDDAGWKVDVTDAAGFSLVRIHQKARDVRISGPASKRFPPVIADRDGFLRVDGHFVGVKAKEVPCLLHGALPRPWALSIKNRTTRSSETRLTIDDGDRDIVVGIKKLGDPKNEELCTDISWRNKLVFKSTVRWCVRGPGLRTGDLTGVGDYTVKWVQFDE
jgi:hypothetical protein